MSWLTAEQALELLGTKSQTLYANVSRGRIRAKPDPKDTRRSLYFGDDIKRLAERQAGRRKSEAVAAEAIRWGDPVLASSLSTVADGRLSLTRGAAEGAAATLEADLATLRDVLFGRRTPAAAIAAGDLEISGDRSVAERFAMAFADANVWVHDGCPDSAGVRSKLGSTS